jgi:hypothetical protein
MKLLVVCVVVFFLLFLFIPAAMDFDGLLLVLERLATDLQGWVAGK